LLREFDVTLYFTGAWWCGWTQGFASRDQLPGDSGGRLDDDMNVARVDAKKTRQVKLCSVSHTFSSVSSCI